MRAIDVYTKADTEANYFSLLGMTNMGNKRWAREDQHHVEKSLICVRLSRVCVCIYVPSCSLQRSCSHAVLSPCLPL